MLSMGIFCWNFTILKHLDIGSFDALPRAGDDLSYPFQHIGLFLTVLGLIAVIMGIIGLFAFIYLYFSKKEKTKSASFETTKPEMEPEEV
jgi:hypothetical protein